MAYLVFFGGLGMLAGAAARLLLGRMRRGARVGPPWCELAVGVPWAACGGWWAAGRLPAQWLPVLLGLAWLTAAASATDLLHRRLPDLLTLPALPAALLAALPLGGASVRRAVLASAVLFAVYLVVRLLAPAALGAGDVKLAAAVGAALGAGSWSALLVGTVLASVLTAVLAGSVAVAELLAGWPSGAAGARGRLTGGVPHGPSMLIAGWGVSAAAALGAGFG
jgi:leader peptidase (prepilin peptidase)/N-methyltransferase